MVTSNRAHVTRLSEMSFINSNVVSTCRENYENRKMTKWFHIIMVGWF